MAKRSCSGSPSPRKKSRLEHPAGIGNVACPQAAAATDADPPLKKLLRALENVTTISPKSGDSVVYWMRMEDMRSLRPFPRSIYSLIIYPSPRQSSTRPGFYPSTQGSCSAYRPFCLEPTGLCCP